MAAKKAAVKKTAVKKAVKKTVTEKRTGEKYASKSAMMKHEKGEGRAAHMREMKRGASKRGM